METAFTVVRRTGLTTGIFQNVMARDAEDAVHQIHGDMIWPLSVTTDRLWQAHNGHTLIVGPTGTVDMKWGLV
jgi:hypothetical protein